MNLRKNITKLLLVLMTSFSAFADCIDDNVRINYELVSKKSLNLSECFDATLQTF